MNLCTNVQFKRVGDAENTWETQFRTFVRHVDHGTINDGSFFVENDPTTAIYESLQERL